MENKSHVVVAVTFLLVLGIGAAVFFLWLSHEKPSDRVFAIVTSQSVDGLHEQASVTFKGLPAGKVKSVKLDPQDPEKVRILFGVQKHIPMTKATYAQLSTQGLVGEKVLNLNNPQTGAKPLATNPQHPARIPLHKGLVAQLKKSGKQQLKKITDILTNAHQLMNKRNRRHLSQTIAHMDQASQRLLRAEKTLMPALQQMPAIARETKTNLVAANHLLLQARNLVHRAQGPVKKAGQVEVDLQDLSRSANQLTHTLNAETLPHVEMLIRSADQTLDHIDRLTSELRAKPQSLIFGPPKARPGPGEPGFKKSNKGEGR